MKLSASDVSKVFKPRFFEVTPKISRSVVSKRQKPKRCATRRLASYRSAHAHIHGRATSPPHAPHPHLPPRHRRCRRRPQDTIGRAPLSTAPHPGLPTSPEKAMNALGGEPFFPAQQQRKYTAAPARSTPPGSPGSGSIALAGSYPSDAYLAGGGYGPGGGHFSTLSRLHEQQQQQQPPPQQPPLPPANFPRPDSQPQTAQFFAAPPADAMFMLEEEPAEGMSVDAPAASVLPPMRAPPALATGLGPPGSPTPSHVYAHTQAQVSPHSPLPPCRTSRQAIVLRLVLYLRSSLSCRSPRAFILSLCPSPPTPSSPLL